MWADFAICYHKDAAKRAAVGWHKDAARRAVVDWHKDAAKRAAAGYDQEKQNKYVKAPGNLREPFDTD